MSVYIYLIIILVVGVLFFDNRLKPGKIYFIFSVLLLGIIAGLRSENVGHDTANYINIYNAVVSLDFSFLFTTTPYDVLEPGYLLISWCAGKIGCSAYDFILLISIFDFVCIGYWIWKNSQSPLFSLMIFYCMFYSFFVTGFRQSIAFAIVVLAYEDIKFRRWKRFGIIVFLAFLFHRTALIFIHMYFLPKIKNTNASLLVTLLLFPVIYTFRSLVFPLLTMVSDRFENYQILNHGDATNYTVLLGLVSVAVFFISKNKPDLPVDFSRNLNCLLISFLIMPFVGLNGSIMRIAMYYTIAISLLIPQVTSFLPSKSLNSTAKIITISVLIYLFVNTVISSPVYKYEFNSYFI